MHRDKKPYKILVVEDNPGDFVIIENLITEKISMPVIIRADNFKQASEIMSGGRHTFDVILLDLSLPDKSGQELVDEMLRVSSFCPIIILTGYTDIDFSIKSIAQGISDYLIKDDLDASALYKSIIYSFERKKSISLLEDSEKRYSDLFHLSPQPMWLFDPESFRFVQVNKAAIELYGYSEEEFLGMNLMDIKLEKDISEAKEHLQNRNTDDGVFKRTITHHKKSGELIEVDIYSRPMIIGDKSLISVIAIDITEKRLNEHNTIKAIIKAQEDERYEIGGELHDNVCQLLAASQFYLDRLKKSLALSEVPLFDGCKENIGLAFEEVRNMSHRLAPAFFSNSTMEEAFTRLFNSFNAEKKLEIFLHFDNTVKSYPLSQEMQLNLYRILQEQLRNIQKYAHASIIEVDMIMHYHKLKMKISDNGVGFNTDKVKSGIGMANMKRRAELYSGKFEVNSSPGDGCEIIVDIPLPEIK
jgi:two-component system, NarL family, sensor histidine kinase UhpB